MTIMTIEPNGNSQALTLLASLRTLSDADANLVLLAQQKGVTYRDIAEAWGVAPAVIARRLRSALLRLAEARREGAGVA